jgi:hypothetical protein
MRLPSLPASYINVDVDVGCGDDFAKTPLDTIVARTENLSVLALAVYRCSLTTSAPRFNDLLISEIARCAVETTSEIFIQNILIKQ